MCFPSLRFSRTTLEDFSWFMVESAQVCCCCCCFSFCCLNFIFSELLDLSQINEIDRFVEPPGEGLLCDLLWSDPIDETTGEGLDANEMLEWDSVDYVPNPDRGCSWVFGYSAIAEFLDQLNLVSVIRAHEVQKVF